MLSLIKEITMTNRIQDTDSAVALFASLNASFGSATNAPAAASTQDRFLKLLVAQVKDRDSLNSADSAQLTSQMAQLNTVAGTSNKNS
jgi:flagellar basal-body rod modification protein FlgD